MYLIGQKLTYPSHLTDPKNNIIVESGSDLTVNEIKLLGDTLALGFEEFPVGTLFPLTSGFVEKEQLTEEDILLWNK